MGYPANIRGTAVSLNSATLDSFIHGGVQSLAVWTDDPLRVIDYSWGVGESPSYTIYHSDNTAPTVVKVGAPLPINGTIWILDYQRWAEHSRGDILTAPFLRIGEDGQITVVGGAESDSSFWGGFARGAVTWAAITTAAVYGAGLLAESGFTGLAGIAGPTEFELATAGMGTGMGDAAAAEWALASAGAGASAPIATPVVTATTEWELATAGMGAGMGTGGVVAPATGFTLAGATQAVQQGTAVLGAAAKLTTTIAATAATIQGGSASAPEPASVPDLSANNSTLYLLAAVAVMIGFS